MSHRLRKPYWFINRYTVRRAIDALENYFLPLWEQQAEQIDYQEYIRSSAWKQKADAAKKRAGQRCQVCNRGIEQIVLDAHHRTYERLGMERDEDITVLCRDCHELYESNRRLNHAT